MKSIGAALCVRRNRRRDRCEWLWALLTLGFVSGACFAASPDAVGLNGVDVYGTTLFSAEDVKAQMQGDLDALAAALANREGPKVREAKTRIEDKLRTRGDFAYL